MDIIGLPSKRQYTVSRSANFQGMMACAGVIPPEFRIRQLLGNRYLSNKWFQTKLDRETKSGHFSGPHIKAASDAIKWMGLEKFVGNVEEKFKFTYVGRCNDEVESELCDCGCELVETTDHLLFECPKYDHLRLGWRWTHYRDPEKRYLWVASKLNEMRSFLTKTKRFDDKSSFKKKD